jgi:hypothetical protein
MIEEEATFESYGYYARDLKPQSHKFIIASCDGCGKVRKIQNCNYHALCRSCCQKGDRNPFYANHTKKEKVESVCKTCGKIFRVSQSVKDRGGGIFCSRKCAGKGKRGKNNYNYRDRIKCICKQCGKDFEVSQCIKEKGGGTYCSRKCGGKANRSKKHHNFKGGPVRCVCKTCGTVFYTERYTVRHGGGKYCCRECYAKAQRRKTGKSNSKYIERVKCICQYCNIGFEAEQYQIDHGYGKFCSHKCYGLSLIGREVQNKLSIDERKMRRRLSKSKTKAKRRHLGHKLIYPVEEGEHGHHFTNEYVGGIPADVHDSIGGSRKKHRTRVLQWLKANDKKKYKRVLCVLAKEPLRNLN